MAQRNPNPNATSDLTNWSKVGSSTTLTATSEGARWQGGSSGTGRAIWIKVPMANSWGGLVYIGGIIVRRNSGTAQITRVQSDGTRWTDWGGGTVTTDGSYGEVGPSPAGIYFPVGQFIRIYQGLAGNASYMTGDSWADAPENVLGHSAKDGFYDIHIVAENNKPFDFTIRGVGVYDSGMPAMLALDSRDAVTKTPTGSDNSLTKTFHWEDPVHAINTLKWEWGDGDSIEAAATAPTMRSRAHTFPAPGIYTVKLTAKDAIGGSVSSTRQITVPTGTFSAGYAYETDFLNINVDASSSISPSVSPIDTYAWNWGDGTTTAANASKFASHTYTAPGTYNVTLTVKDNATNRVATAVKSILVVAAPNPDNYFVATKDLLKVGFIPSIQDGTSYSWNFGDGESDTVKEPTHTYAGPGTYAVTLTVNGTLNTTQDVTVNDVYTPLGKLQDALSVEVAVPYPAGTIYNRIKNPSGELGAWGWSTPLANSYVTASTSAATAADKGISGAKLIYRSSGSGTQVTYSTPAVASPGQYASVQLQSPYVDGGYRATVQALNAAGTVLGSSATTGYQTASVTATVRTTPYLLPASTTHVRVMLNHYSNATNGTPAVNKIFQFRRVMLALAATSGELTANPYLEFADWQDLIGPTSSISVTRDALNVGTISVTVLDSTFDPATNGTISFGQACRLRVKTADESGNLQWESIYTGNVIEAPTKYLPHKGTGEVPVKSTRITLAASDNITTLSQTKQPNGVAKIDELPEILEAVGVPFEVNGSTDQVAGASIVNANENASVLDQVAITRDTEQGYAFVDRNNTLKVVEPAFMPTIPVGIIDEKAFSDVEADYDFDNCINEVYITWLKYTAAAGTEPAKVEEVTYGPYRDSASIEKYGLRSRTFTMLGVENPTTIAAKANAILAANKTPKRIIRSVTIPIRNLEDLAPHKALIDLYDLVKLGYARTDTVDQLVRVTSIKHTITPKKWLVTLGFEAEGTVASPQFVAAPPVSLSASGIPFGARRATAAQSIANATVTQITSLDTSDGLSGGMTWSGNQFTVPKAGIYMVSARVGWLTNGTGVRFMYIFKNGASLIRFQAPGTTVSATGNAGAHMIQCNAGDTISLHVYQTSGGALSTDWGAGGVGYSVAYLGT